MYNSYQNYPLYNNYRVPNYYDTYNQGNYNQQVNNQPIGSQMNNANNMNNASVPVANDMIKGKYVNSLNEVIELSSSTYEPYICVDFNAQKVYIKTFNIDGSYTIEEFIKNQNAKIDTRNQTEKLADTVSILANEVIAMKNQLNQINTMNNGGVANEQSTKQPKSK